MTTFPTSLTPQLNAAARVSVSSLHGGMIVGHDLAILQPIPQPTSSHHTSSPSVQAVPRAPAASSSKLRLLSHSPANGAGSGTATSSSEGSDSTRRSATKTTLSRRQRRDWVVGDYILTKTLGASMGNIKLATHTVTGEKVLA